jgi:GT2 family glycosyltransferase
MNPPPLSVILPVHNGLPYLEESLRSLLGQTFGDFELVAGDDGSSDGSTELLRSWAERDSRIRLLRRERPSGLAASQNWLVGEARAPLIAVAHADDLSYPDRLRRQVELLRAEPGIDLVGTLWDGLDEKGRRVRPGDWWRLVRRTPFAPFSHSSTMFRRSSFDRVGGYRPGAEYWEDLDLYYRIAADGRVAVIPEVLAAVRHTRTSTRLRQRQERVEEAVDLMYRATGEYSRGLDHSPLLGAARDGGARHRLHPLTFVSCGSTNLWSGHRPGVMRRMWRRAALGPDAASLHALAWVGWGTLSPMTLRLFLSTLMRLRNLVARPLIGPVSYVDWPARRREPGARG